MNGKEFKEIAGRIPDEAQIVKLCGKYVAWRLPGKPMSVYSFHPDRLDGIVESEKV